MLNFLLLILWSALFIRAPSQTIEFSLETVSHNGLTEEVFYFEFASAGLFENQLRVILSLESPSVLLAPKEEYFFGYMCLVDCVNMYQSKSFRDHQGKKIKGNEINIFTVMQNKTNVMNNFKAYIVEDFSNFNKTFSANIFGIGGQCDFCNQFGAFWNITPSWRLDYKRKWIPFTNFSGSTLVIGAMKPLSNPKKGVFPFQKTDGFPELSIKVSSIQIGSKSLHFSDSYLSFSAMDAPIFFPNSSYDFVMRSLCLESGHSLDCKLPFLFDILPIFINVSNQTIGTEFTLEISPKQFIDSDQKEVYIQRISESIEFGKSSKNNRLIVLGKLAISSLLLEVDFGSQTISIAAKEPKKVKESLLVFLVSMGSVSLLLFFGLLWFMEKKIKKTFREKLLRKSRKIMDKEKRKSENNM